MTATLDLSTFIRDIPDFPSQGVVFKDITPLLADPTALAATIDRLAGAHDAPAVDKVLGVEARGFIFAAPVAYHLQAGFVPVRKPGKLPWNSEHQEYDLEYGTDRLEIHSDAVRPGERILIVDDVLATGGTAAAAVALVERLGGVVVGLAFLMELEFLNGRAAVPDHPITSLLTYR